MVLKQIIAASLVSSLVLFSGMVIAQTPQAASKSADASTAKASPGDAAVPDDATTADDKTGSLDKSQADSKTKKVDKPPFEVATFGGGCFWHVEEVFDRMKGVKTAVSGYAGGTVAFPSYEMVHTGQTGHIEVVKVVYDPAIVSYEDLLKVFWKAHDPTSIDRQGPDEGPQYRSAIFYHNEEQRKAALKSYQELTDARAFARPIVTRLLPMRAFYEAEAYHQDYYGGKPRGYSRTRAMAKSMRPASSKGAKKALAQQHQPQPRGTSKSSSPHVNRPPTATSAGDDEPQTPTAGPAQP